MTYVERAQHHLVLQRDQPRGRELWRQFGGRDDFSSDLPRELHQGRPGPLVAISLWPHLASFDSFKIPVELAPLHRQQLVVHREELHDEEPGGVLPEAAVQRLRALLDGPVGPHELQRARPEPLELVVFF